ncbi:MAG: YybS family protein [Desulfobacteraceae bacterium]|nr:YybS family protein [Desulfobacteraceae bacterium]
MNQIEDKLPPTRSSSVGRECFFHILLTLGLFASITFVPFAGFISGILTPAPTAISVLRWGYPLAWIVPGGSSLAGIVALAALDMGHSIPYFMALLGMGLVLGHGIRSQWRIERTVGLSCLVVIGMSCILLVIAYVQTQGEMVRLIEQDLRNAVAGAVKSLGSQGPEAQALEASLLDNVPMIVRIMPGIMVSCTLGVAWLNLLVVRRYCRTVALEGCIGQRLCHWKAPEFFVWIAIGGGLMTLLPWSDFHYPGTNVIIVLGSVYFLQGLAIVAFYFDKFKIPVFPRALVYAILFLQQFASVATAALGLFDMWFDFRRLKKPA